MTDVPFEDFCQVYCFSVALSNQYVSERGFAMQKPPKLFVRRGKRVRARHDNLKLRFALWRLVPLFVIVAAMFHLRRILAWDWQGFSFVSLYISLGAGLVACGLAAFWYRRYRCGHWKQLEHRQKLARMVLDNGWCERVQSGKRTKIRRFARLWYRKDGSLVSITAGLGMNKYQDRLLELEILLEPGLFCELIDKTFEDGFLRYTLLYDSIYGRISIDKVTVSDGCMKLMESVTWNFDDMPHMLVAGGTGGGKTYFLLSVIYALLRHTNAELTICDPKISALVDLETILPRVYAKPDDISESLLQFHADMLRRYEEMKAHPSYETGKNYVWTSVFTM